MEWYERLVFSFVFIHLTLMAYPAKSEPQGQKTDMFEVILNKMRNVTGSNCYLKSKLELELPRESVAQTPKSIKLMNSITTHSNRSVLVHLHNSAFARAFYYSYIYRKLDKWKNFEYQPSLMHFYISSAAEVSAGWAHGSAIWFDNNRTYPNWDQSVAFNHTLELFGIRAWKKKGYKEPISWLREPAQQTVDGQVFTESRDTNYTEAGYRFCPYTGYTREFWWPSDRYNTQRFTGYTVGVRGSNSTGSFTTGDFQPLNIVGAPTEYELKQLSWSTKPYFDCGRSNKWVVSMVSPVIEILPRYTSYTYLQFNKVVAIVGRDVEFEELDINPCPVSIGNPRPNIFAGTARCRNTTVCEPLSGFGFRRGGYQCVCRAGLYYPWGQDGPFQGADIEQATEEQYVNGTFDCVTVEELSQFVGETPNVTANSYEVFDKYRWSTALSLIERTAIINRQTCINSKDASQLYLPKEAAYGVYTQFEAQGRTALKTAHFLSQFLQNADELSGILTTVGEYKIYSSHKKEIHKRINETHVFAEVVANVMSDSRIVGLGVFFDRNKFKIDQENTREFFGPFAYRSPPNTRSDTDGIKVIDFAGFHTRYINEDWYRETKEKWTSNLDKLEQFTDRLGHPHTYILEHQAPVYTDGVWSRPMFKCDGRIMEWVVTYTVPFFGPMSSGTGIEFKGVVLVDVKLEGLDINQCPAEEHVNNAFKNTAKCHYESQYCVPLSGMGFTLGAYKCECRQGYVYPATNMTWFDGQMMEEEYKEGEEGEKYRNDTLECRKIIVVPLTTPHDTSGSQHVLASISLVAIMTFLLFHQK